MVKIRVILILLESLHSLQRDSYPRQFISLGLGSREEVDRVFSSLAEGGIVVRPLGKVFFCEYYGRIIDRFGAVWELMI